MEEPKNTFEQLTERLLAAIDTLTVEITTLKAQREEDRAVLLGLGQIVQKQEEWISASRVVIENHTQVLRELLGQQPGGAANPSKPN